jgi:hypothetical protein
MKIKKSNGKSVELNVSRQATLTDSRIFNYFNGMECSNMDAFRNLKDAEVITMSGFEYCQIAENVKARETQYIIGNLKDAVVPVLNQWNEGLITEHECFNKLVSSVVKFLGA